ncbi:GNAT family N-acetyltransferase [Paludibacterium paludis]|uniref:RimJ/RimL family protein N-acetyltransferase n=1 Tax=Paludibacterium paludis TaxID=1225769 RepID=A0A918NXT0_9NEIS|nr:GNAT family N-acetyltransferase [Paludibacterium paludis]GGY04874.1 hypothetical protein GCM10011289_04270 [Paludibacterium paludis]
MPSFCDTELATPRLALRPLGRQDAEALFAIFSDPRVMRYWSTPAWASIDRAHELLDKDAVAMRDGDHLRLALIEKTTERLLGYCTLFDFSWSSRRASLGYGLAFDAWGKGLMREAASAMLDYGFGELGLNRSEAGVDPGNAASIALLERLGFVREGVLREHWAVGDTLADSVIYGLLRREWAASRHESWPDKAEKSARYKPDGHPPVSPYLIVRDLEGMLGFLETVFRATVSCRRTAPDGMVFHAEARVGDSVIMMGARPDGAGGEVCSTHVYVPDVDACHARALEARAVSLAAPQDRHYGDRTASVRDPEGHVWWIGSHLPG